MEDDLFEAFGNKTKNNTNKDNSVNKSKKRKREEEGITNTIDNNKINNYKKPKLEYLKIFILVIIISVKKIFK
jgi:hypothetical protein